MWAVTHSLGLFERLPFYVVYSVYTVFFGGMWIEVEAVSHLIQTIQFVGQARGLILNGFPVQNGVLE